MKRVAEKVRDIVEVCPFTNLHDFAADPAMTLGAYHFTDITADLMSKWVDRIVGVKRGQGAALALAGFRGVGKSHFLSVVTAVISRPELRVRINDQHVASSADRLSRRHGSVVTVRRGSGTSLIDELKTGIANLIGVQPGTLGESLYDLLLTASEHAGDQPLVILVDTALGRGARVARDDGAMLSELAEAAKALGLFLGVALDDDISGADGPNLSISSSFAIDYLDQEHLYKIVDSHIFAKHSQMLPVLHEIYEDCRASLPAFRWSEPRFTSLYPLHPATLEIAPLIRLYIHDFALLGFAAEAGVKILGRPANSLIGLDEVFDSVESRLRTVEELKESFVAYDKLEREVVSKTPVQFRLPAKLILKGLYMLSLNGQGSTALEVAASMMIVDDKGSAGDIGNLLDSFATAMPNSIERVAQDGAEAKYCFRLSAKNDVDDLLAESVKTVPDDAAWSVLLRQTAEKYSENDLAAETGSHRTVCSVEWRGAIRRGEIVWNLLSETPYANEVREPLDWTVRVETAGSSDTTRDDQHPGSTIVWQLGELKPDELDTIKRYHLMQSHAQIRDHFADGLSTALHVHTITIEKIWQRVFLDEGRIISGQREFQFSDGARSAYNFSHLFTAMLAPIFASRYPAHPEFLQPLGIKQSAAIITGFFSGTSTTNADTQKLAEDVAFPLGLAVKQGDQYVPAPAETLIELPIVKTALEGFDTDSDAVFPLSAISSKMRLAPAGLTREAQHLIVAALVAQRKFEFVTSSGNRINHRSLDLQIIWDDIVGISKPLNELYTPERLVTWAKLITANAGIQSLDRSEDRLLVIDSLSGWLAGWREGRIIEEFDALPDENLNAAIWRIAANLRKSFGAVAETIEALIKNDITLDECIHTIGDLFSDSEEEFEKKKNDLRVLRNYTAGVKQRDLTAKYVSLSETTDDGEVEKARRELLDAFRGDETAESVAANDRIMSLGENFKKLYANHYAAKHDAVLDSAGSGEALKEILRSEAWAAFESFSAVPLFDQRYILSARSLIREMRQLYCVANVREALEVEPYCSCSFSLSQFDRLMDISGQLRRMAESGLHAFKKHLVENTELLVMSAESDAMAASIREILTKINEGDEILHLPSQNVRILKLAASNLLEAAVDELEIGGRRSIGVDDSVGEDFLEWEHQPATHQVFVNSEL